MSSFCTIKLDINVKDSEFITTMGDKSATRFSPPTTLTNGKRESISLAGSAFTALSPPTNASCLIIPFDKAPNDSVVSLTLKSITGDNGIPIVPATNLKKIPLVLPLGATPSIGILNGSASVQVIEILWI
jgi:hypothetical protein